MSSTSSSKPMSHADARRSTLGQLVPLWPHEIADRSVAGQQRICRLLLAALRRERQRGIAGHWGYDIVRHAALARALGPELRRLALTSPQKFMPAERAGMCKKDD